MITKVVIQSFKSLLSVEVELGHLNVFVGANGSGKSNFLEAVGILSAAADGRVNDQSLLQRGVRPGVPKLYKSAFAGKQSPHIYFQAQSADATYAVSLNNPLNDPSPAWKFKTELLQAGSEKIASRGPNSHNNSNKESGLAALKLVELPPGNPALDLMQRLRDYAIYSPVTPVLRGVAPETQPREPLGLTGGLLPNALQQLLALRRGNQFVSSVCRESLELIGWAKSFGSAPTTSLPLSPAASASARVVRFKDRFMVENRNVLSGYDASEGALYILFLSILAAHPKSPKIFAIDNADHGLNPGLAKRLFTSFSRWILHDGSARQVVLTSHNPAVLDGLPLQDDRVRLFTVDRDTKGRTTISRVNITPKMLSMANNGWTLSRMWTNKLIGGMPNV
jgi:energy-coupling factor transporter ATP-binding protein EcfA2